MLKMKFKYNMNRGVEEIADHENTDTGCHLRCLDMQPEKW